jgi:paraquat-inducible protein B
MARKVDPRIVGVFVLTAVALGVAAAVYLGAGRFLQRRLQFVVFFAQDLHGLDVDAPVKFRGVQVGRVASIHLSVGSASEPLADVHMPVIIEITQTRLQEIGDGVDLADPKVVETLVQHGLRARLALDSYLTNRRYVDLDVVPDAPPVPPRPGLRYPEIPVRVEPGLDALQADASRLFAKVQALDLEGLVMDLRRAAGSIERAGDRVGRAAGELPGTLRRVDEAVAAVGGAARSVQGEVGPLAGDARAALVQLRATLERTGTVLEHVAGAIEPSSPAAWQVGATLEEVRAASRALRYLAEGLERNPSELLRGRAEVHR